MDTTEEGKAPRRAALSPSAQNLPQNIRSRAIISRLTGGLKFSQKILLMPAVAFLAFAFVLLVNESRGRTNGRLLEQIERGYIPALELSQELQAVSIALQRSLQDAAAAEDSDELAEADRLCERMLGLLDTAADNPAAPRAELRAIRGELVYYYPLVRKTVEDMIRNKPRSGVHESLQQVQVRYAALRGRLESLTARQRSAAEAAFAAAAANQTHSRRTMSIVIGVGLLSLGLLSVVVIGSVRRSMTHAAEVAARLSKGDFSTVIVPHTDDEFGRLLSTMQDMMAYLRNMAAMSDRIAGQTGLGGPASEGIGDAFAKMLQAEVRSRRLIVSLQQRQRQLDEAQRLAHLGSWEWDLASNELTWSQELCRIFGTEKAPAGFERFAALVHASDRERVASDVQKALRDRRPFLLDYRIVRHDGAVRILHANGGIVLDDEGNPLRMVGTAQDVTEMREAMTAREASEARYRALFDHHPQPMWVVDAVSDEFLAANDAAVQHYGYSAEEFLAMSLAHVRLDAETATETGRHRKKDGTLIDVTSSSQDVAFGERAGKLFVVTDVTERRRLEDQLRQAQKMEAVGRLAGGVAHDFNNLLNVITGYSELLQKKLDAEHPLQRNTAEILKAAERAADLTRQLLAFSRKQVLQPRILDLNMVVTDTEKMLRRLIGEDIELRTALQPALACVKADPGQIEQVIMNLVVNARDAMPRGGKLCLETKTVDLDAHYARTHNCEAGRHVMLAVSDTGSGIPADVLAHIFEPFFTTKEEGKGTGLGLSTVYGIVSQSGGHTQVYSEVGRGTTFKIYLPISEQAGAGGPRVVEAPAPTGSETVLVVEDEVALREVLSEILTDAGYDVIVSDGPARAIEHMRTSSKRIDLVVTDVVMPGMSGPELVKQLEAIRPFGRALFMSGYTDDAIGQHGLLDAGVHFLQKPFVSNVLLRKVRAILEGPLARSA
jgi:PAS domain S-box-containing protein